MFPSIPAQIRSNALRNGSKVAIVEWNHETRRTLSYSDLYLSSWVFSSKLPASSTNATNRRIAVMAGNVLELYIFYLACAIQGCVAVPINVTFTPREVAEILDLVRPCEVYCESQFKVTCEQALRLCVNAASLPINRLPSIDELRKNELTENLDAVESPGLSQIVLRRPWAILHTSGTTSGKKKGVMRNQLGTIAGIMVHQYALKLSETDTFFAVWPSYGISSFFFVFGLLYLNARAVIADAETGADAVKSWDVLLEEEATFTTGSPLHFEDWSRVAKRSPSDNLRVVLLSGASTSALNKLVLADSFGERCSMCEAYGSTECGVITLSTDLSKPGVGCEPPGVPRVKLNESTGEILVNPFSPMFMNGYVIEGVGDADFFENGWFKTGDVARRDAYGNLQLMGRVDDRIGLPNGHDLYPAEVESVLAQVITGERQILVSLVRDELVGVITGPPADDVIRALTEHAEANLAPLKRPRRYVFVSDLPLTSTNKIKRKDLALSIAKL